MDEEYQIATHTEDSLFAEPVRAPFDYYGAKQRVAKKISKLLPPHNAWPNALTRF